MPATTQGLLILGALPAFLFGRCLSQPSLQEALRWGSMVLAEGCIQWDVPSTPRMPQRQKLFGVLCGCPGDPKCQGSSHTGVELASRLLGSLPRQQVPICLFSAVWSIAYWPLPVHFSLGGQRMECEVVHLETKRSWCLGHPAGGA